MSAGTTQHLQGLVARKSASAEPQTHAQYFNHVADVVRVNDDLTALRTYNLKRRRQVAYQGYEAVLNRKKRSAIKTTPNGGAATLLLGRISAGSTATSANTATAGAAAAAATLASSAAYISPFQAATTANANAVAPAAAARPQLAATKTPKPILAAPVATPSVAPPMIAPAPKQVAPAPVLTPAPVPARNSAPVSAPTTASMPKPQAVMATSIAPPVIAHAHAHAQAQAQARAQQAQLQAQAALAKAQSAQAIHQAMPKRSDFTVGTAVLIRHTADLVACGARNLAGKTGRIVSAPQLYGQELYSVYIDDHETVFQVPFNALTLPRPSAAAMAHAHQHLSMKSNQALIPGIIPSAQMPNQQGMRQSPTLEQIKMEHSVQLHRLMQQQYREIQVLQQRYAECRLVNPAALTSIQNELSKLRLVHLSQVQTLKSKQALDLLGK